MPDTGFPLVYTWTGDGWVPARGYMAQAQRRFVAGQTAILEVIQQRSGVQHKHYFAAIREAFANLDERATERLKTPNHLRKWALIECDYYDEQQIDCGSKEVAFRMATFARKADDYAEISVRDGSLLSIRTAKSQKTRAMNAKQFTESSNAVLDLLSDMVGVSRKVLEREARKNRYE